MAYASIDELRFVLRIETPTQLQMEGMQRALDEAATEIDWELGYTAENPAPSPPPALVHGVNIDRAVEHWRQQFSPFGVIGTGGESEPIITARNSWYRHALKLRPLKNTWGVA
jgi:hypothetical protein